jgi:hypothetical protein
LAAATGLTRVAVLGLTLGAAACRVPLDLVTPAAPSIDAAPAPAACDLPDDGRITVAVYADAARARMPAQLAVVGSDLYLLEAFPGPGTPGSAAVFRVDACGGALTKLASAGPYNLGGRPVLAASATTVYFGTPENEGSIIAVGRDGRGRREVARAVRSLCGLLWDARRDRLLVARCGNSGPNGALEAFDPATGQRSAVLAMGRAIARVPLALHGGDVAWVEDGPPRVMLLALDGGAPLELHRERDLIKTIALDASSVTVATTASAGSAVTRVPRDGGAPQRLPAPETIEDLVATSVGVFAASKQGLLRVDAQAATLTRVADGPMRVLATDGRDVFMAVEETVGRASVQRLHPR